MIENYLFSVGGGGLLGFLAGFALKRIIKITAIILGAFILGLAYLSYKGWVHPDWNMIQNQTYSGLQNATQQASLYIQSATEQMSTHHAIFQTQEMTIAAGIGFVPGFLIGLKH